MRRFLPLLLSLLLLASLCTGNALAAIDLDSPAWVVDDANVLSQELEEKIIQANQTLEYDCQGAQLVVVTVTYPTAGMDREEFAKEIFDTWNIGSAEYDNGALLVIYTESDEFWLECGYGIYNSPYVDEIADMVADDSSFFRTLKKGNYERAVSSLVDDLSRWYSRYYGSTVNGGRPNTFTGGNGGSVYHEDDWKDAIWGLLFLLILVLIIVIACSPLVYRQRYGRWGVWPFVYFSPWWSTRRRLTPTRPPWETSSNVIHTQPYHRPPSSFGSSHSSSHSGFNSHNSHSSHSGFGGFSGGHSGGGFHGGGGHSGGGFGHR